MHDKTLIAIILALAVAGCNDKSPEYQPTVAPAGGATAPAAEPAATVNLAEVEEFGGDLNSMAKSELCSLDAVNGGNAAGGAFTVSATDTLIFEGWVATSSLTTPERSTLVLSGADRAIAVSGNTGVVREDVANAYGSQALANSGFKLEVPGSQVPAGEYTVAILHDESGSSLTCGNAPRLIVN